MGKNDTKVMTSFDESGRITQQAWEFLEACEPPNMKVAKRIIDTAEQHVRQSLIDMGWTPPPEALAGKTSGETVDVLMGVED